MIPEEMSRRIRDLESELRLLCVEREHYYCDDTWYSCPKHPEGGADRSTMGAACNCGADEWNALVAHARAVLENKEEESWPS